MTVIAYVFPKLQTVKEIVRRMFRWPRFRTHFDSQDVKASETLMKSA